MRVTKHPNPNAPAYALEPGDLELKLRIIVLFRAGKSSPQEQRLTILGAPCRQPWKEGHDILAVQVQEDGTGQKKFVALAAMGLMSYPDGRWARAYAIRAC